MLMNSMNGVFVLFVLSMITTVGFDHKAIAQQVKPEAKKVASTPVTKTVPVKAAPAKATPQKVQQSEFNRQCPMRSDLNPKYALQDLKLYQQCFKSSLEQFRADRTQKTPEDLRYLELENENVDALLKEDRSQIVTHVLELIAKQLKEQLTPYLDLNSSYYSQTVTWFKDPLLGVEEPLSRLELVQYYTAVHAHFVSTFQGTESIKTLLMSKLITSNELNWESATEIQQKFLMDFQNPSPIKTTDIPFSGNGVWSVWSWKAPVLIVLPNQYASRLSATGGARALVYKGEIDVAELLNELAIQRYFDSKGSVASQMDWYALAWRWIAQTELQVDDAVINGNLRLRRIAKSKGINLDKKSFDLLSPFVSAERVERPEPVASHWVNQGNFKGEFQDRSTAVITPKEKIVVNLWNPDTLEPYQFELDESINEVIPADIQSTCRNGPPKEVSGTGKVSKAKGTVKYYAGLIAKFWVCIESRSNSKNALESLVVWNYPDWRSGTTFLYTGFEVPFKNNRGSYSHGNTSFFIMYNFTTQPILVMLRENGNLAVDPIYLRELK